MTPPSGDPESTGREPPLCDPRCDGQGYLSTAAEPPLAAAESPLAGCIVQTVNVEVPWAPTGGREPVTRSEMRALLDPLQACLLRIENSLKQLSSADERSAKHEEVAAKISGLEELTGERFGVSAQNQTFPESAEKIAPGTEVDFATPSAAFAGNDSHQLAPRARPPMEPLHGSAEGAVTQDFPETQNRFQNNPERPVLKTQKSKSYMSHIPDENQSSVLQLAEQTLINQTLRNMKDDSKHRASITDKIILRADVLAVWWHSFQEPERQGLLFRLVTSRFFETACILAIVFNSALVAFTADFEIQHLGMRPPESARRLEQACLCYFVVELLLRMTAHRCYFFINRDMGWNIFDLLLVSISMVDFVLERYLQSQDDGNNVAFMRVMRLLKLAKILRALRSLQFFKSLAVLLESFAKSFVSLFWGLVLLAFVLYLFALIIMQGLVEYLTTSTDLDSDRRSFIIAQFGSLGATLVALYKAVTGGEDWGPYYDIMNSVGSAYGVLFMFFTFVFLFALFNILTGSIVEKAMAVSKPDKAEQILEKRRTLKDQKKEFVEIFQLMDKDRSDTISFQEFEAFMSNPVMLAYMASIGVEMEDVELFFETMCLHDETGLNGELRLEDFIEGCMHMKSGATALDMQRHRYEMRIMHYDLKHLNKLMVHLQNILRVREQPYNDSLDSSCPSIEPGRQLSPGQSRRKYEL